MAVEGRVPQQGTYIHDTPWDDVPRAQIGAVRRGSDAARSGDQCTPWIWPDDGVNVYELLCIQILYLLRSGDHSDAMLRSRMPAHFVPIETDGPSTQQCAWCTRGRDGARSHSCASDRCAWHFDYSLCRTTPWRMLERRERHEVTETAPVSSGQ